MPSHQHSQPSPHAPSVGLSQSSSTKRMSCTAESMPIACERAEVKLLQVRRRRLEDHLKLVVVLQPVGVLAVAAVLRPARRLHIGGLPRLRPERAQGRRRVKGARAHLHVVGLQDHAALVGPEALQGEDEALERLFRAHMGRQRVHFGRFYGLVKRAETIGGTPRRKRKGSGNHRPQSAFITRGTCSANRRFLTATFLIKEKSTKCRALSAFWCWVLAVLAGSPWLLAHRAQRRGGCISLKCNVFAYAPANPCGGIGSRNPAIC